MIKSQLSIITQGQAYLDKVALADYVEIVSPNFISSAGSHMRHVIDHYLALITGIKNNHIDYDVRHRGNQIESSPQLAKEQLSNISNWINNLSKSDLDKIISLSTEVSITKQSVQKVTTTVARELIFLGTHSVHHYSMISQICYAQNAPVPEMFGVAPGTLSYLRQFKEDSNSKVINSKNSPTNTSNLQQAVLKS
jgi:uncharacterized damage-inducible protein DinB